MVFHALSRPLNSHFSDFENDLVAAFGEFVGTVLFLLFSMGVITAAAAEAGDSSGAIKVVVRRPPSQDLAHRQSWFYISASFGLSLFAIASVFYRFTGSIFNPSVGLALVLTGVIQPVRFILTSTAQMVGAIVAAAILDGLTPGPLHAAPALGLGTNRAQGLFIEMFATAALTISVLMLAAEKHLMTPMAPQGFGYTLFIVELMSVPFTGGAVNTARAFGPACIQGFESYHWLYWLGPTLGALLATAFYVALKWLRYWEVNPGQDSTNHMDAPLQGLPSRSTVNLGASVNSNHSKDRGGMMSVETIV